MSKKKRWTWGVLSLLIFILVGCDYNQNSVDLDEETTTEEESYIFDKVIAGESINEINSLYDVTDNYQVEGYDIVTTSIYGENEILIVYVGEVDSMVVLYDISKAEELHKIIFQDLVVSNSILLKVENEYFQYLYNAKTREFIFLDIKEETSEIVKVDFIPESMVVASDGGQIVYTKSNDTNIYKYTKELGASASIYDYSSIADFIRIKYLEVDNDTLVIYIENEDFIGYASLSVETDTLTIYSEIGLDLLYTGDVFVYRTAELDSSVVVYDNLKPRIYKVFQLEEKQELSDLTLFDGLVLLSKMNIDNETYIRIYDLDQGIMNNEIALDQTYTILNETYLQDKKILCIEIQKSNGEHRILLWDVEIVEDAIS